MYYQIQIVLEKSQTIVEENTEILVATIGATAVLGHIGCATFDLTVFAGIACHSAVLVIQAAAMDDANIALEECL